MKTLRLLTAVAIAVASVAAVAAQAPKEPPPPPEAGTLDVRCWDNDGKEMCVPVSILKATFATYEAGSVSPLAIEQNEHLATYRRWREADAQLVQCRSALLPLQAPRESEAIEAQQRRLVESAKAAAPPGTVFDEATGKYITKPPAKPEEKPKGGGGQ